MCPTSLLKEATVGRGEAHEQELLHTVASDRVRKPDEIFGGSVAAVAPWRVSMFAYPCPRWSISRDFMLYASR